MRITALSSSPRTQSITFPGERLLTSLSLAIIAVPDFNSGSILDEFNKKMLYPNSEGAEFSFENIILRAKTRIIKIKSMITTVILRTDNIFFSI
jgi:hypothetical protein